MNKAIFLFSFIILISTQSLLAKKTRPNLDIIQSPYIEGRTLYITGVLDSHIYDFFSYNAKSVKNVDTVSLNSYGGKHSWTLEVARKIQELGLNTIVEKGSFCASACVYLFGSGKERIADESVWFGIHGARLGAGRLTGFWGTCFITTEESRLYVENLKGCKVLVDELYELSRSATADGFRMVEKAGVSPLLRETYNAMEDHEDWPYHNNFYKKPDWFLDAIDAVEYNLVTKIIK